MKKKISLEEMARIAKERGITYGQLQQEETIEMLRKQRGIERRREERRYEKI